MKKRVFMVFIVLFLMLALPIANAMAEASSEVTYDYDYLYGPNEPKDNCVAFVKKLVPTFPSNGFSIDQKKGFINSYVADVGSVAIMTSNYQEYSENTKQFYYTGHVGYVEKVSDDRKEITIVDANFGAEIIQRRVGSTSELHIVGYYNPNNVSFYEHHDQKGWVSNKSTETFVQKATSLGFSNDQLSCVVIRQSFITVRLYEHDDYQGRCLVLKGVGVYNLGDSQYNFNDICSSYVITTGD